MLKNRINFNKIEYDVLSKLLDGDSIELSILRKQFQEAIVVNREFTGSGFFTNIEIPKDIDRIQQDRVTIGDVIAEIDGLRNGAGFVLFTKDGRISTLEGYSYDEPWPNEMDKFTLKYIKEPRDFDL